MGAGLTVYKAFFSMLGQGPFPPIKGIPRDPKVTAGFGDITGLLGMVKNFKFSSDRGCTINCVTGYH